MYIHELWRGGKDQIDDMKFLILSGCSNSFRLIITIVESLRGGMYVIYYLE